MDREVLVPAGGRTARAWARLAAVTVLAVTIAGALASAAGARTRGAQPRGARFFVGAAKADITPASLDGIYDGGYGIGPVHPAKGVLRHIYVRVFAVRDAHGAQVVIGSIDAQGYSIAYQQGPYGIADIAADIERRLGIPASHLILQATHSHNGPDDLGVWGGVPDTYLAFVKRQAEAAIVAAVTGERPAELRWATADLHGFSGTFGSDTDATHTGDQADYPIDGQLRALEAVAPRGGQVIATLLNVSTHPTVYGPLDRVSPDWPGAAATYLEHDELGIAPQARYGFPGSVAVVTVGALGHTWPAGVPAGAADPAIDPPAKSDNGPADDFGNAVARRALAALAAHPVAVRQARVAGTSRPIHVLNTNPVLLAGITEPANPTPLGGYKIMRADTPPWDIGDVYVAPLVALRIGELPFFSVPGEPYPSLHASLAAQVGAPVAFVLGLAEDQLGYAEQVSDYNGALQCSAGDEWFFTISPTFGSDVVRLQEANARAIGFGVHPAVGDTYGVGPVPPATNCAAQQAGQLPTGAVPVP